MDGYFAPKTDARTEFTEKKSRFITHVKCVGSAQEAEQFAAAVRRRYADARHNCWAYRVKFPLAERYSDDGEPQGTAGAPMLSVLQKEDLFDICVVVTRYFGGVLLGASGLVRAYSKACADGTAAAGRACRRKARRFRLRVPYRFYDGLQQLLAAYDHRVQSTDFGSDITLCLLIPAETDGAFIRAVGELSGGQIVLTPEGEETACF